MATPDFILSLRSRVGTELLWITAVTAVVVRDAVGAGREVLLVRRADNGEWTPVTGIIDPGEEPAVAAARECLEEADVVSEPEALVWVHTIEPVQYPNGDRTQYLDLCFRFRYVSGTPLPADGENTEAGWFHEDALPEMNHDMATRVAAGLRPGDVCEFRF